MSEVTTKDLEKFEKRFDKRFDDILGVMSTFANDVNQRFEGVNQQFDSVNQRFDKIENILEEHNLEFRKLNKKYDHLLNTIDGFIGRIDRYETELVARDHKIERLERWIQQIATTSGVKLT